MATDDAAEARILLDGLAFPESPRWHDGRFWLSDWAVGEIVAVDLVGRREVIATLPALMCIDFLPDGRLLIVDPAERRLVRREPDGTLVTHAELGSLGRHPWNDIVVDGRGNAYVNNVGFDFPEGEFAPGTVVLVTRDGTARQVADGLAFPNGMAVTPDNRTLLVAESYGQVITAFDIAPDGSLSGRRAWAAVPHHPDGICLDAAGAVWYADVGTGLCVRVREGGAVLGTVQLDRGAFACVLGGPDRRTLLVVTNEWGAFACALGGADRRTLLVVTNEWGEARPDAAVRRGQAVVVTAPVAGVGWP